MVKQNIRTDKWQIVATGAQRQLLSITVSEFRCLVRCLVGVVNTHWSSIGRLDAKRQIPAVEKLIHATAKNPFPKYQYFNRRFYKFPSYYRRGAIQFAVGQVSSFNTRYREWQSGIRKRKDTLPPRLNAECGTYPPLYKGQCVRFADDNRALERTDVASQRRRTPVRAAIKVFTGTDWLWETVGLSGHRQRHLNPDNQRKSPYLIVNNKSCHLSVPFKIKRPQLQEAGRVLAIDLGINTTATASIVNFDGTVTHREFIHPGRDIDRRDSRLKKVSKKARLTGKLSKGFARGLYRKAGNINREIGQKVSARLVKIARQYDVKYTVFEHLKGWRPKGGKRKSTLRQRFHGWLHRRIVNLTEMKWSELGGKVVFVNPRGTSSYAYDGSGKLKRDNQNYALARFANSKLYNADLSASYNIGARGILKLCGGNSPEVGQGKNSCPSPRSRGTLSMLWVVPLTL